MAHAIHGLCRPADLRVWSVIVTIFGDLARDRNDVITSAALTRILEMMSIKPPAVRVALHRLRRDGWIESLRTGRTSAYRLTRQGYLETNAARGVIYGHARRDPNSYVLAISPPGARPIASDNALSDVITVANGVYLIRSSLKDVFCDHIIAAGDLTSIPLWAQRKIGPADLAEQFQRLTRDLDQITADLLPGPPVPPLSTTVLRIIIIHRWRRLILQVPDVPDHFFPSEWPVRGCRSRVLALLSTVERTPLDALQAACAVRFGANSEIRDHTIKPAQTRVQFRSL